jgi:hypothetical protein
MIKRGGEKVNAQYRVIHIIYVMKQTRTIQHDESHTDTEELFGDVWVVTQCNCTLLTQETTMSRTLNGNLTGRAAHGIDELDIPKTDYAIRLDNARARVKDLFDDKLFYASWIMRIPEGSMLETMENIIAQITRYDEGADAQQAQDWQDEPATDPADVSKYFNGIPATATKTWRERHLNKGG